MLHGWGELDENNILGRMDVNIRQCVTPKAKVHTFWRTEGDLGLQLLITPALWEGEEQTAESSH